MFNTGLSTLKANADVTKNSLYANVTLTNSIPSLNNDYYLGDKLKNKKKYGFNSNSSTFLNKGYRKIY